MLKRPLDDLKDSNIREHIRELQEHDMQKVTELDAAPTADAPLLEADEWGNYDNKLYHRVGENIYEFTPSDVISIT